MRVQSRTGWVCASVVLGMGTFLLAQTPYPAATCAIGGRVTSGTTPLPGVSLSASRDGAVVAATATDVSGAYRLRVPPGDYRITADLAAFAPVERTLSISDASGCASTLDLQLVLRSRAPSTTAPSSSASATTSTEPARPVGRGGRG